MKKQDIYNQWKNHRMQVPVPNQFTVSVMQQVQATARQNDAELTDDKYNSYNRLTRIIVSGGMILLGLFRIGYILANLLQSQVLVH